MTGLKGSGEAGTDLSATHGVIVMDKPEGITSFDVIRQVRKVLGIGKIGHTGTLDPLATGVLPLCINEATKMASFLTDADKEYLATIELGVRTDTQDMTGTVIERRDPSSITRSDLESVAKDFLGLVRQKVPRYSAAKYQGRPYHRWTRQGVLLDTPEKEITIHHIEIESFSPPHAVFRVTCSRGTYIRTLCDDMGGRLGCGASMAGLRRTRSGSFGERDALTLDQITEEGGRALMKNRIIPLPHLLPDIAAMPVTEELARKIRNGYQPVRGHLEDTVFSRLERGDLVRLVADNDDVVAVAQMLLSPQALKTAHEQEQALKLVRVFNG